MKPLPPVHNFVQPTGPGYYSFLDFLDGNCRSGPPKYGYQRSASNLQPFYDADFRYLDNPENTDHVPTDFLKRVKIGDNWMLSTGGQAWDRFMNITHQGLGTARGQQDLGRIRTYLDLWHQDMFRVYVEFISAGNYPFTGIPPGPNDVKTADFLDLFIDVKLFEWNGHPFYARTGRQELVFGSQRLISNVDFTNDKRTFQGVRGTYRGDEWDYDIWWARPVINDPYKLDSWDDKRNFAGSWATYHPNKTDLVDLYWLYEDNQNSSAALGILNGPTAIQTPGFRHTGNYSNFLWDFENAVQFGKNAGRADIAGMSTSGIGYNFKSQTWNPTVWLLYDWASGTHYPPGSSPTSSTPARNYTTFNQLYAFGHTFFGSMDLIGRQNINDINLHVNLNPTPYISFWAQYHYLWLDSATDALYNFTGAPIRRDATGAAGTQVGSELNFITNFHLTANQDIQVGYGHLFGGEFLKKTGASTVDYTYVTYGVKW